MFFLTPFRFLKDLVPTYDVCFDHCVYGLAPPAPLDGEYIRKATRILSNFPSVVRLCRTCPGPGVRHRHVHAMGRRRVVSREGAKSVAVATWAGRYPVLLCDAIARLIVMERAAAQPHMRVPKGKPVLRGFPFGAR